MGNHEYYGWSNKQAAIDEFTTKTGQEPDKVVNKRRHYNYYTGHS